MSNYRDLTVALALELPGVFGGVVMCDHGGSPDETEVLRLGASAARAASAAQKRVFALGVSDGLIIVLADTPEECGADRYDYEL